MFWFTFNIQVEWLWNFPGITAFISHLKVKAHYKSYWFQNHNNMKIDRNQKNISKRINKHRNEHLFDSTADACSEKVWKSESHINDTLLNNEQMFHSRLPVYLRVDLVHVFIVFISTNDSEPHPEYEPLHHFSHSGMSITFSALWLQAT